MERMMKLQDVLLKAMAKKITWWEAAEIIGVTDRTMRRWRERLEEHGYSGLADRRKGKVSFRRVPLKRCEEVLRLYREKYFDCSMLHFQEKLREGHGIELSYTWVQQALQGAGLVKRRKQRGPHRRRRERRPFPGMLLHIDGSKHRWFSDDRYYDLLVILDDATSEIYYAQLVEEESTRTVMAAVREVVERRGLFCALYSDRGSHFFWTPKAGEAVDRSRLTQVGRAMKELGIQMIPAYSPQARGRCERNFGTWQGRLPQELRLAGISTLEEANAFLRERYMAEFNQKFAVLAKEKGTAFRRSSRSDLDWVFSIQTDRVVARDNTIAFRDQCWQIEKTRWRHSLAGCTVTVHEHLDGRISVRYGPHIVANWAMDGTARKAKQRRGKDGAWKPAKTKSRFPPSPTPPWKSRPNREIPTFPPRRRRLRVHAKRRKPRQLDRTHRV
jgi:transposase